MNRKGLIGDLIMPLFLFFLVASVFTFVLMFTQEGVGTEIVDKFTTEGNNVATKVMNDPTQVINNSLTLQQDYERAKFNYDWLFLLAFILLEFTIIELAINTPRLPSWNYLTWLFFGTIILSFTYSFVMDASSWFVNNYILGGFFPADVTYLPFYNWFIEYELIIFVVNLAGALTINQIFAKKQGIVDTTGILGGTGE